MSQPLRYLLVPGGGGSGPAHWHQRWAAELPGCEWIDQVDPAGGSQADWVNTIDRRIGDSDGPTVLIAHSLACIAVAHWGARSRGPVVAALLVAPADIDDDWAEPGSLYKRFQPIPMQPLPFPSTVVASRNDPLLSVRRARELAGAWGSEITEVGDHLHLGSDAELGSWPVGRTILDQLLARTTSNPR